MPPAPGQVEDLHRAGDALLLHDLGRGAGGGVVAATGGVGDHVLQPGGRLRGAAAAGAEESSVALVLRGPAAGEGEGGRDDGAEGDAVKSHR